MRIRDDQPFPGSAWTNRRRLLEAGGVLAGAAVLFGGAPAAGASDAISSATTSRRNSMPTWRPDPTFYPSPRSAMQAPAETLAFSPGQQPEPRETGLRNWHRSSW